MSAKIFVYSTVGEYLLECLIKSYVELVSSSDGKRLFQQTKIRKTKYSPSGLLTEATRGKFRVRTLPSI